MTAAISFWIPLCIGVICSCIAAVGYCLDRIHTAQQAQTMRLLAELRYIRREVAALAGDPATGAPPKSGCTPVNLREFVAALSDEPATDSAAEKEPVK